MSQPLILVAASGLAREAAEALRASEGFELLGFLDDDETLWGSTIDGVKVLGGLNAIADYPDAALISCAGKGAARREIVQRLAAAGVDDNRFASVIHPSVLVPESCTVGAGCIVLAGCVLTASVTVGRHVVLMPQVSLTHDDVVADYATLCAGVTLGGTVTVGEAAYLGMSSAVRENVTIGSEAIVGMGSIVLTDVGVAQTVFGVPARVPSGGHPSSQELSIATGEI